ncbi:hypothetical protein JNUCC0626_42475 [Lentzea sp. JNUCC 0626]|uniref:hypothetical protein n=1 Tax=Lentzea sp. JNUCC 0626 TaxID=3367513 RepID=UPI003748003F
MSETTNLCTPMPVATTELFAQQRLGLTGAGFSALLATLVRRSVAGGLQAERLLTRLRHTTAATVALIPLSWRELSSPQAI